jgi:hypothetical protein
VQSAGERALASYARAVASELGVPPVAVTSEISETAAAYVRLGQRSARCPECDLMLVWTQGEGWFVAPEGGPEQQAEPLGYLGGREPLLSPRKVAEFVAALLAREDADNLPAPAFRVEDTERYLARRLRHYLARPETGERKRPWW